MDSPPHGSENKGVFEGPANFTKPAKKISFA